MDSKSCGDCKENIVGKYFILSEKHICDKCYEAKYQKSCSQCKEKITGTYFTMDEVIYCDSCYKEKFGSEQAICPECNKEVKGQVIRAVGNKYHPECFTCFVCKTDLTKDDVQFTTDDDNKLYCQNDYNEKFAPRCNKCKKPIAPKPGETTAKRLTALEKDWHPDCFNCEDCSVSFAGDEKCYPIGQSPLCMTCNKKRSG